MPVPVFEQAAILKPDKPQVAPERTSGVAVFFTVLLVSALTFTVELALRDVNRIFNPLYEKCVTQARNLASVFDPIVGTDQCLVQRYEGGQLLLHADIVIPLILIIVLILAVFQPKTMGLIARLFRTSLLIFSIWLSIRILAETEYFLVKHYPIYGKYLILLTVIIAIVIIVVAVQKKAQKGPNM
ncbi:hypothetical protein IID19_01785 [Patescibacteria group bacterium]|nr:hypothetical protein [Patescibacteria group bacterium]